VPVIHHLFAGNKIYRVLFAILKIYESSSPRIPGDHPRYYPVPATEAHDVLNENNP
jgi:hypothetical protein